MKRTLFAAAMIAISAAAWLPTQAMAQVDINLVIGNAPPPPRFESVPQPRSGYVWAPGYWNWDGQRHVWSAGHWEPERDGARYQRAEWVRESNGWRLNRGGWNGSQGQYREVDYVQVAPPPPRYERVPRPQRGYVWAPGHWEWRGHRHAWVKGMWVAERPGYVYAPPAWHQRDGRWYMEQSRWEQRGGPGGRGGRGDSDRDGIPNRYDQDRDNDGVSNRHDRDRDGDGVSNRNDRQPDNPRRD